MKNKNKFFNTNIIVEAGIMLALAIILGEIKLFKMPQGGSVSLGMLPLIIFSIRWGVIRGIFLGSTYGIMSVIIFSGTILGPIQFILDYPLAYGMIGISGFYLIKNKIQIVNYIPFIFIAYILKFICHFLSGMIFFAADNNIFTITNMRNSFLYNITYIIPEIFIIILILIFVNKTFSKFINV